MRFGSVIFALIALLLTAPGARSQTNTVRTMSLAECIRMAVEHNFDVQIQRLGPVIARFDIEGSYSVYDPVLEASAIHDSNTREGGLNSFTGEPFPSTTTENNNFGAGLRGASPWGLTYNLTPTLNHRTGTSRGSDFDFYEGRAGVTLRQPLLRDFLIDAGRQNILVAKKNLHISEAALASEMMTVVSRVEVAYLDLIFTRENIKVQEKALELAERLLAENRKRVEVGTLAPLDEKQAEAEVAARLTDVVEARQAHFIQQNVLKNLLTDDFRAWHAVEIVPEEKLIAVKEMPDLHESWHRGLRQRPDLQQSRLDLEKRDIQVRFTRNQTLPSVDLVGSYGHNGLDSNVGGVFEDKAVGRSPFYSAGVVFSMPLSNRGPRNAYRASKAEREQAQLRLRQLEQAVLVQIDDAVKRTRTTFERVEATRKARQFAEAALDAEQRKLEAGKRTSFVVLQLQKDLTAARSAEIRALADYNKALSELAFNEGSTLEKNQLSLK